MVGVNPSISHGVSSIVNDILHRLHHLRALVIGVAALALSAGLAFGAEPPTSATFGLTNAGEHAGKTVPVQ